MDVPTNGPWAPGTATVEDLTSNKVILQPHPSPDPEQPLNWTKGRKAVNFALVCFYSLMTFVLLDIGTIIWTPLNLELGISYQNLNNSYATSCAGLAVGCIFFVPAAIILGRRPMYMLSILIQFGSCVWMAKMNTTGELIASNVLGGLGGAISESIVQMTISDMFFVHQRATMNAIYLIMVSIGSFLAPVAAGYSADSQGWRWIWWWTAIFLGAAFVFVIFFYEETKYIPRHISTPVILHDNEADPSQSKKDDTLPIDEGRFGIDDYKTQPVTSKARFDDHTLQYYSRKSLKERLALITLTPGGSKPYFALMWDFIYLLRFPAVAYTALIYGISLVCFSIVLTTLATYFAYPPYNFTSAGIGLLNLAPFVGSIFALFVSSGNDWIILQLARRNNRVFEPEMRLWLALPGVFILPAGMLLFGLTMARGYHWIIPAVGSAMFGFGFNIVADTALTYLQDCYFEVVGSALVPIAFFRNGMAMMITFCLTPWIDGIGLSNTFICASMLVWACYMSTIPMIIWGKKWRISTAQKYVEIRNQSQE